MTQSINVAQTSDPGAAIGIRKESKNPEKLENHGRAAHSKKDHVPAEKKSENADGIGRRQPSTDRLSEAEPTDHVEEDAPDKTSNFASLMSRFEQAFTQPFANSTGAGGMAQNSPSQNPGAPANPLAKSMPLWGFASATGTASAEGNDALAETAALEAAAQASTVGVEPSATETAVAPTEIKDPLKLGLPHAAPAPVTVNLDQLKAETKIDAEITIRSSETHLPLTLISAAALGPRPTAQPKIAPDSIAAKGETSKTDETSPAGRKPVQKETGVEAASAFDDSKPNIGDGALSRYFGGGKNSHSSLEDKARSPVVGITAKPAKDLAPDLDGQPGVVSTPAQQIGKGVLDSLTATVEPQPPSSDGAAQMRPAASQMVRTLDLALDPANLGTVRVRLDLKDKALNVEISASKVETAHLLVHDRDALGRSLVDAGYDLGKLSVYAAPADMDVGRSSSSSLGNGQGAANFGGTRQDGNFSAQADNSNSQRLAKQTRDQGGGEESSQARTPALDGVKRPGNGLYV